MSIHFEAQRWERIREDYAAWWAGKLDRPLMQISAWGFPSDRAPSTTPYKHFLPTYGLDVAADAIIDAYDYGLSATRFFGDAFPTSWLNFGAGSAAAYLGADLDAKPDTVWFHPREKRSIESLDFDYDPANVWLERTKEIGAAAARRWEGSVQIAMADLGGTLDIVSTFLPGDDLLTGLYLNPDHVKRLTNRVDDLWFRYFDDIDAVYRSVNPGYTAWTPIFSADPYYMLQCDFAYMIGPDMFDEFVKPSLTSACRRLKNAFYHLDGVGQLAHLDSLLSIDGLKGIQWIPGDGKAPFYEWPDVYRRIRGAGKLMQVFGSMAEVDRLIDELGSGEGLIAIIGMDPSEEPRAHEFLDKHGFKA